MWFDKSIRRQIKRRQDDWAQDVRVWVETVYDRGDLHLFSLQQKPPSNDTNNEVVFLKRKRGMNVEKKVKNEVLLKLIEFIEESENERITLKQCQEKMREFVNEPFTTTWLKERFIQHYDTSTMIAKRNGWVDVIYFSQLFIVKLVVKVGWKIKTRKN